MNEIISRIESATRTLALDRSDARSFQLFATEGRREIRRDGVPLWFIVFEMRGGGVIITEEGFTQYAPAPVYEAQQQRRARDAARGITPAI